MVLGLHVGPPTTRAGAASEPFACLWIPYSWLTTLSGLGAWYCSDLICWGGERSSPLFEGEVGEGNGRSCGGSWEERGADIQSVE